MNDKKNKQNHYTDDFIASCSSCECTGLIPSGDNISQSEFLNYKEIYNFSVPQNLSEEK